MGLFGFNKGALHVTKKSYAEKLICNVGVSQFNRLLLQCVVFNTNEFISKVVYYKKRCRK